MQSLDVRHGKMGGSGWVIRVVGKKWIILSGLKRGSSQLGYELSRVELSWPVFFT